MIRLFIIVVVVLFLAIFGFSNTDQLTIWLASLQWQVQSGIFIFAVPLIGLVIGYLLGWMGELQQRRRARRAESQVRSLEKEVIDLHKRLNQATASATTPAEPSASSKTPGN